MFTFFVRGLEVIIYNVGISPIRWYVKLLGVEWWVMLGVFRLQVTPDVGVDLEVTSNQETELEVTSVAYTNLEATLASETKSEVKSAFRRS